MVILLTAIVSGVGVATSVDIVAVASCQLCGLSRLLDELARVIGGQIPVVLLEHMRQLDNVFALFVFLARHKGLLVLPAKGGLAIITINVGHRVQSRQELALDGLLAANVYHCVE